MSNPPDIPRQSELLLWLVAGLVAIVLAGMIAWQTFAFGWHPAREEPPLFDAFHWLRIWISFGLGALVVGTLVAAGRESPDSAVPLSRPALSLGWLVLAAAAAATGLFLSSPVLFHQLTIEDGAIEWSSALLLFVACGLMLGSFWRRLRRPDAPERWRRLRLAATLGLAAIFLLMAMEEISWFQRVIGFDTPEPMAERNWQGEFNFHNFQTDLTELGLYAGTGLFLLLLPLMRETVGGWRVLAPLHGLLPDRTAAAASAPMLLFAYGHWNLLPVQLAFWIGFGACAVFAARAMRKGWRGEALLFAALTILLAAGQAIFLLFGDRSIAIYDSTEYREWFIALGLAVYGWRQWRSAGRPDA